MCRKSKNDVKGNGKFVNKSNVGFLVWFLNAPCVKKRIKTKKQCFFSECDAVGVGRIIQKAPASVFFKNKHPPPPLGGAVRPFFLSHPPKNHKKMQKNHSKTQNHPRKHISGAIPYYLMPFWHFLALLGTFFDTFCSVFTPFSPFSKGV